MEFIRNIVIIDADKGRAQSLKAALLGVSKKLNVHLCLDRLQFTEISSKIEMKAVFINGNIGKKDLFYLFRFFSTFKGKDDYDIPLYFTADDYELIQDVMKNFSIEGLEIMPSPVAEEEIVRKLSMSTLGKFEKDKKGPLTVDKEFLEVFIRATQKVMVEMANNSKLKAHKPELLSKLEQPPEIGIGSKIVIATEFFKGTFFVLFPEQTFLNLYERAVQEKHTAIDAQNQDFASELANIIYGQSKKTFSETGYNLEMVIPALFKGEIKHNPVYVIPFDSDVGPFHIAIAPGLL